MSIGIGVAVTCRSLQVEHLNLCLLIGRSLLHVRAKSFASKYSVRPQAHSTRNIIPRSAASPNVSIGFDRGTKEEQRPCAVKLTCGNLAKEIYMSERKTSTKPDRCELFCDEVIALCGRGLEIRLPIKIIWLKR